MKLDLPPPRDWQPFEDLCRDLWAKLWSDLNAQKHGRTGQKQQGVDVFGQPDGGTDWEAVQCKCTRRQLTRAEIEHEVKEARAFEPGLRRLIIATTAKRDTGAQEMVREISDAEVARGSFPVSLWTWNAIAEEIVKYRDIFLHYYPDRPPLPQPPTTDGPPFGARKAVVPPWFVGRQRELGQLDKALERRDGVSVLGDGMIGKSSLLSTWQKKLRGSGREAVLVDGQGSAGSSPAAFVAEIIGQPAPEGADPAADALEEWAAGERDGLAPVVLVDEFDDLPEQFGQRFSNRLCNLLGAIVLVVASRREVNTLYREQGIDSPLGNRLQKVRLGLLDPSAAQELIRRGAAILDQEDAVLMDFWAGRHPSYLQLLGLALIEARELGDSREDGLDRFRDQASAPLREVWEHLNEAEREGLRRAVRGQPTTVKSLAWRGLLDANGRPFGEVLAAWLRELA